MSGLGAPGLTFQTEESDHAAADSTDAVLGEQRVEHLEEAGAVLDRQLAGLDEFFGEAGVVDVERSAGDAINGEVVDGDVEGLSDADERVEAGRDPAVPVATDPARVTADVGSELVLGPVAFRPQLADAFSVQILIVVVATVAALPALPYVLFGAGTLAVPLVLGARFITFRSPASPPKSD